MSRRARRQSISLPKQGGQRLIVAKKKMSKAEAEKIVVEEMRYVAALAAVMITVVGTNHNRRIGIDFGRCIASDVDEHGNKVPVAQYHLRSIIMGALWMIQLLVQVFGVENIYIIRNGFGPSGEKDDQPFVRLQTKRWFARNKFFEKTGVSPNNVYYPETREGKQKICERLHLTELIEDRAEVAKHLVGTRWVSFMPIVADLAVHLIDVPDDVMNSMVPLYNWVEVGEYFFETEFFEMTRLERIHGYRKAQQNFRLAQAALTNDGRALCKNH